MIFDEQSRDDARAHFAERRLQKLDAAAEEFLASGGTLMPIKAKPLQFKWTAQGELFSESGDDGRS